MGAIRKKLLIKNHAPESHKVLFEKLISRGLLEMVRDDKKEDIDHLLHRVLGKGYVFEDLMEKKQG